MQLALIEALAAGDVGDVPVGCIIVIDGVVIGRGRNRREQRGDPTAHAECEALREAAAALGSWRVEGTLYVTQEPCTMCAGAIVNARVRRLVYGCDNPQAGGVTWSYSPARIRVGMRLMTGLFSRGGATPAPQSSQMANVSSVLASSPSVTCGG